MSSPARFIVQAAKETACKFSFFLAYNMSIFTADGYYIGCMNARFLSLHQQRMLMLESLKYGQKRVPLTDSDLKRTG